MCLSAFGSRRTKSLQTAFGDLSSRKLELMRSLREKEVLFKGFDWSEILKTYKYFVADRAVFTDAIQNNSSLCILLRLLGMEQFSSCFSNQLRESMQGAGLSPDEAVF